MLRVVTTTPGVKGQVQQLEGEARRAVRKASPWIVWLGRFGLAAKGTVYVIIGWLAIQSALQGGSGGGADKRSALQSILEQPFGTVLLGVVAVGLLGYMLWRIVQALLNPEREKHDAGGWAKRLFRLGSGIVYGALGISAIRLLIGMRSDHRTPSDWTAILMRQPFGKWLVVAAGLGVIAFGLARIVKAWQGELKKQLVLDGYAARARAWILGVGRFGQAARGVVFVVIGAFVVAAGWHTNPAEAKGLGEALSAISRAPYGPYLLGATAAGLIAYGLSQFVEARYRRIHAQ